MKKEDGSLATIEVLIGGKKVEGLTKISIESKNFNAEIDVL
jgi:hypothetical protein